MLSLYLPGAGQLYNGQTRRGLAFFSASIVPVFLLFLGAPLVGVWVFVALGVTQLGLLIWSAGHALIVARGSAAPSRQWFQRWYFLVPFALIFQTSMGVATERFGRVDTFYVAGGSMEPTLLVDEELVVDNWHYRGNEPARGDLVVFELPEQDQVVMKVNRIVGLGGESISIENKAVLIDGRPLVEPFTQHKDPMTFDARRIPRDNLQPTLVPADAVFVMGDNRDYSHDSRFFGPIARANLVGRVQYVYESSDLLRIGSRPGPRPGLPLAVESGR